MKIIMTAGVLRALAGALEQMAEIERSTGVLLEGRGGNTLMTNEGDTVEFGRQCDANGELIDYYVSFER